MIMLLNVDIVDIEKLDGLCLPTFVVDGFSGVFLHSSIFYIHPIINHFLCIMVIFYAFK